jgi:GH43 family beta-xylosidase
MIITDITYIGDPQIVLHEGVYYCYATSFIKGFYVWKSTDLVNWSEPKVCFDATEHWGDINFWAPEVIYHNGKFVMHYTARISKNNRTLYLGVATSDSPEGPFVDVWGKPMFDLGYSTIDGSVLVTDEGNYFYYSRDCSQNFVNGVKTSQVYCVELDDTLTRVIGEHKLMTTPEFDWELKSMSCGKLWNEGPTVIKVGDKYVMNYSANHYATNRYAICIAQSDSPLGPWVKHPEANPVLSCREELFGAGHNAFFTTKEGKLMTSFHVQTNPSHPGEDRRTCIGEVRFTEENGIIKQEIL